VALYIGNNQVVQAPQSGDVVRISSMWFGSDYFGAVRPTA
jgi:cell wall-associated NlpC family hydrolase